MDRYYYDPCFIDEENAYREVKQVPQGYTAGI